MFFLFHDLSEIQQVKFILSFVIEMQGWVLLVASVFLKTLMSVLRSSCAVLSKI